MFIFNIRNVAGAAPGRGRNIRGTAARRDQERECQEEKRVPERIDLIFFKSRPANSIGASIGE